MNRCIDKTLFSSLLFFSDSSDFNFNFKNNSSQLNSTQLVVESTVKAMRATMCDNCLEIQKAVEEAVNSNTSVLRLNYELSDSGHN